MRDPTLLLPFALPPAQHAKDLIAALHAPSLAILLARAAELPELRFDGFAAALPHEMLLYGSGTDNSPPLAHPTMQRLDMPPQKGYWFMLQPVHLHIARDHLVLTDQRHMVINEDESRTLFDSAAPLFQELGYDVRFGDARHWFVRADDWHSLRTTTPDAAAGHNVDVWLPAGEHARAWRKLHNEVQMLWHGHPLNETRELHGQPRINALWLWGGGSPEQSVEMHQEIITDEALITSALADDWGRWLTTMQDLDQAIIAPHLHKLQSNDIDSLTLRLSDATRVRRWRATRFGLKKFWRTPSLANLLHTP